MKKNNDHFIDKFYNYCFQADLKNGLKFIKSLKNEKLDDSTLVYFNNILSRFLNLSISNDVIKTDNFFLKEICKCYRKYYKICGLKIKSLKEAEIDLFNDLLQIMLSFNIFTKSINDFEDLDRKISDVLKKDNIYYLGGKTLPLRCVYIWKNMEEKEYKINLIDKTQKISVFFMKDFIELGWLNYFTLGKRKTGGWATKEALYCVYNCYKNDIETENFKINYLTHEAQHFSDFYDFPNLIQHDLEYRAKLVELIKYQKPLELLKKFSKESKNNKEIPHSYASYIILKNLQKKAEEKNIVFENLKSNSICYIAEELFKEHTNQLLKNKNIDSLILKN